MGRIALGGTLQLLFTFEKPLVHRRGIEAMFFAHLVYGNKLFLDIPAFKKQFFNDRFIAETWRYKHTGMPIDT